MEAKTLKIRHQTKIISHIPKFQYSDYRKLVVSTLEGRQIISYDDILYAHSSSNYCTLVLKDSKIVLSKTLKWVQNQLDETFLRVHNSYLVSLLNVTSYNSKDNALLLACSTSIPVSRRYKPQLLGILKQEL